MLNRLSVENFVCFGPRLSLDLAPPLAGGRRLALVVGPNGCGKSSLLRALACLRGLVLSGSAPAGGQPVAVAANLFCPTAPSRIEIEIEQAGAHFTYGFAATALRVEEEWLQRQRPGEPPQLLFRRWADGGKPVSAEAGEAMGDEQKRLDLLLYGTRPEQLLLNEGLRRGVRSFLPIGTWLRDRLQLILPEAKLVGLASRAARDPAFAAFLGELLALVDPSVAAIEVLRESVGPDAFDSIEEQRELAAALTQYPDAFAETPEGELIADAEGRFVDLYRVKLSLLLAGPAGVQAALPLHEVSAGMQRLLHLAPLLHRRPGPAPVFFLDDLAHGLAPVLLPTLLDRLERAERDRAADDKGQLIATLHDRSQLGGGLPPSAQLFELEPSEHGPRLRPNLSGNGS